MADALDLGPGALMGVQVRLLSPVLTRTWAWAYSISSQIR